MMKKNNPLSVFWLLLFTGMISSTLLFGQESSNIEHTINSTIFNGERKVKVFLPERYFRDSSQNYIATYVLDAQSNDFWNMVSGNIGYLVRQYQIIPTIVVGIVSDNRGREFNPNYSELQEHLEKEVLPLIRNEYRVDNFKILIGHSWGGAFVGNTLFSDKKDMFDAYIGISPSLGAIDGRIYKQADTMLSNRELPFNKYFYCSTGNIGYREHESFADVIKMDSTLQKYKSSEIIWKYEIIDNTDHWSCVIPSINNALLNVSRNYFADQKIMEKFSSDSVRSLVQKIEAFNSDRENRYGYYHEPNYSYYTFVADDFRIQEKQEAARDLYLLAIDKGDNRVVTYFNLGLVYESLKDEKLAKDIFHKTLNLLEEQKNNHSEQFYKDLKLELNKRL